jgi:hypothetical protein
VVWWSAWLVLNRTTRVQTPAGPSFSSDLKLLTDYSIDAKSAVHRFHLHSGEKWDGIEFSKGNCGVSISRSGEAMEKALRECCRAIRIGKILIDTDAATNHARVLYSRLWPDIDRRRVLLLYPIMSRLTRLAYCSRRAETSAAVCTLESRSS